MATRKRSAVQNSEPEAKTQLLQRIKAWKTEAKRARLRWLGYFCALFLLLPFSAILQEQPGAGQDIGTALAPLVLPVIAFGLLLGLELLAHKNRRFTQRELTQQLAHINDETLLPPLIHSLDSNHPKLNHLLIQTLKRFFADTSKELAALTSADWEQLCSHLLPLVAEGEFEMVHLILQRLPVPASPRVVSALADLVASDALWPLDILWEEAKERLERLLTSFDFRFGLPVPEAVDQWIQQLPSPYFDNMLFAPTYTVYSLQTDAVIEPRHMGLAYLAIGKLLPQLPPARFQQLSKRNRATLYWNLLGEPVTSQEASLHLSRLGPQYAHAVLDKIAQVGDTDALPYLKRFVQHGGFQEWVPREIRAQAHRVLLHIEECAKQEEVERSLLRASTAPSLPTEEMLRPAYDSVRRPLDETLLLRRVVFDTESGEQNRNEEKL
ncbi:MAG TPA: hypothetical protein VKV18_04310 [Chthonomonas sp.]|uniref:hypothetical protein n=1 Tax=Chthonomonas sp. TaxID=2282153 RepID=UPI002B4B127F|nr:hypothetical protein [Chthonomonas sp.]HLI47898.1 hypothetical protein [Chthonomonas sp.]